MVQFISLSSVYLLWGLAKRKSFLSYDLMTTDSGSQIPDKIADIIKGARWRWGNGSLNDAWCHLKNVQASAIAKRHSYDSQDKVRIRYCELPCDHGTLGVISQG